MEKVRLLVNNQGPNEENEKLSVASTIKLVQDFDDVNHIQFLIHTKNNTGYLDRVFGEQITKKLFTGIKQDGIIFKIETLRTLSDYSLNDRVIAAFGLTSEELLKIEDYDNVKGILGHSWLKDGLLKWAQTWDNVQELTTNSKISAFPLPPIEVQKAFDDLTFSINMSTGISHPSDEELCKTYLRALKKYSINLNEEEILAYLMRIKGWSYNKSKDVISIISKINLGKSFNGGSKTGLQNHIKRWRK